MCVSMRRKVKYARDIDMVIVLAFKLGHSLDFVSELTLMSENVNKKTFEDSYKSGILLLPEGAEVTKIHNIRDMLGIGISNDAIRAIIMYLIIFSPMASGNIFVSGVTFNLGRFKGMGSFVSNALVHDRP